MVETEFHGAFGRPIVPEGPPAALLERLLAVLIDELGAPVRLELHPSTAAQRPDPVRGLLPIGDEQHTFGTLVVDVDDRGLSPEKQEFAAAVAAMIRERLESQALERAEWNQRFARVREVLDDASLNVVYQPIADLRSGEIVGVEALSRFPGMHAIPPQRWFVDAASVGLGVQLELYAISEALRIFPVVPEPQYLSVNVSPATVVSPQLRRLLRGVDLSRVVFEITEHAAVSDYEELNEALASYRRRGLRVAVDDAGAGFASLRHVLRLSPDIIKLDVSLTRDIDHDSVLRALSYTLSAFASAIDADVVAEGIETERELQALCFLGVSYGQGFHLKRPGPLRSPQDLSHPLLTQTMIG